jgi:hypothetical protein
MSLVEGYPNYYWMLVPRDSTSPATADDTIALMDQAGRDAVDAQRVADRVAAEKDAAKQMTDSDRRMLGFMKAMVDEINVLRQALSISPARTLDDYKQVTKNNIDQMN